MNRLIFLVHKGKEYTVRNFLRSWGQDLADRVAARHYPNLRSTGRTPWKRFSQELRARRTGILPVEGPAANGERRVYIFADLERLSAPETASAAALWRNLSERPDTLGLLNHPLSSVRRFALLERLHDAGINPFAVYRASEDAEPRSWPVFVRPEDDHGGHSPLVHDPDELAREIARQKAERGSLDGLMVVEFCDTVDEWGYYRKYAAFRVGKTILARQLHFSHDWVLRFPDVREARTVSLERDYVEDNLHAAELAEIFELARIEYGRIDYTLKDGRIVVWEINTNPMILIPTDRDDLPRFEAQDAFARRFKRALTELLEA